MPSTVRQLLIALVLAVAAVTTAAQEADQRSLGAARTVHATTLRASPSPDGLPLRPLPANQPLRWVEGERRNGFLRVIQERGPIGWVAEADLADLQAPLPFAEAEPAVACATSLAACGRNGCEPAGTPHALLNRQKRRAPLPGATRTLGFEDFRSLQQQAEDRVGQAQDLSAADRGQLTNLTTSAGAVSEGSRVRLAGFIADGPGLPRANAGGESVNCRLTGTANSDFHVSIVPQVTATEWEGIVVEMIPQQRPSAWTLARLKKARQQKRLVLVTGPLFYDNAHTVNDDPQSSSTQPKRFSLWEIHRVTGFKVCLKPANACDPAVSSHWSTLGSL